MTDEGQRARTARLPSVDHEASTAEMAFQGARNVPFRAQRPLARFGVTGESAAFVALTAAAGLVMWRLGAAVLNTPGYLDPWIYRALFRNFDYLFAAFDFTYYPSRLPWIIPGRLANALLPSVPAFLLLHTVFALSGAIALYLLLREFFGRLVASIGYFALLMNPIFFIAHSDDYPDGAQITYLLLMLSAALMSTRSSHPPVWLIASGVFACAAVTTNLFDAFFVAGGAVAYLCIVSTRDRFFVLLLRDIVAFLGGMVVLLTLIGSYAAMIGGEFLYFMSSVRAARNLPTENWRITSFGWIADEPRILAPVFLIILISVLLRPHLSKWREDGVVRATAGLAGFLFFVTGTLALWEFAFNGQAVFEVSYYFSVLTVAIVPAVSAAIAIAIRDAGFLGLTGRWGVAGVALAAAGLPVVLVFSRDGLGLMGHATLVIVLIAMPLTVAAGLTASFDSFPRWVRRGGMVVVICGALLCVNLSAAGSLSSYRFSTHTGAASYHDRIAALHLSDQLIAFMHDSGLQSPPHAATPAAFWIDASSDPIVNSVQSAYLYGWTAVGYELPQIDPQMRLLLSQRRPHAMVLLCAQADCDGGVASLGRAGYAPRLLAARRLSSRGEKLWARAYLLPGFAGGKGHVRAFYRPLSSPTAPAVGTPLRSWNLGGAGVETWGGNAAAVAGAARGTPFQTTSRESDYELVSPTLLLPRGRYRVLLDGRVRAGGLDIGVLDVEANAWISHSYFWYGQRLQSNRRMANSFALDTSKRVQIVLLNWVPGESRSRWQLGKLSVVALP